MVSTFLRGRHGDVAAAAQILAQALFWREQYQERAFRASVSACCWVSNSKHSFRKMSQALSSSCQDILTGRRAPKWQGDLRILAQGQRGHPLLYLRPARTNESGMGPSIGRCVEDA